MQPTNNVSDLCLEFPCFHAVYLTVLERLILHQTLLAKIVKKSNRAVMVAHT